MSKKDISKETEGVTNKEGKPTMFFKDLEAVENGLQDALKLLSTTPHKALSVAQRRDLEKAQELLGNFKEAFDTINKSSKEIDFSKPLKDLAYSQSFIGKVESVFKGQLEAVENRLKEPITAFKDNKICQAVGKVIQTACNFIATVVKSGLNNAIAAGEFAKSIVELGKTISQTVSKSQDQQTGMKR